MPIKLIGEAILKIFSLVSPEVLLTVIIVLSAILAICREEWTIIIKIVAYVAILGGVLILVGTILPEWAQWLFIIFAVFCIIKMITAK